MPDAAPLRVLVVEDDPDARANLCDVLEIDGHAVVPAATAREALARDDWDSYAAILLDWRLPDGSAETLLPELRRLAPEAAVIVSTGVGGLDEAVAAIRHGAFDYIPKPVDADLLRASLRRVASERRLLAEKARSESAFRALVEAAGSLIVILHRDGRIAYMNPAGESITGHRLDDVRDVNCLDLYIPPGQHAHWKSLIGQIHEGHGPVETEQPLDTRSGERRWILWNIRSFDDYAGEPMLLAIGADVTARKQAEERLLQSERLAAIGKAMAGLAHESRNALQRAQANLDLLALLVEDQPEARELVQRLQGAQRDLFRFYEEVRQYAAPISLRLETCELTAALQEAWDLLSLARQGRDARLQVVPPREDTRCRIDRFQMVQTLRNILENSLAATKDPVRITASFASDALHGRPALRMSLRDNGPGIPREQCSRIFDEFFTTKQRGTGLGLAIVRRIVEAHGGRIVANPDVQEGAELLLLIPQEASSSPADAEPRDRRQS